MSFLVLFFIKINAQSLKPYVLAGYSTQSISEVKNEVKDKLKNAGFKILGDYNPLSSNKRVVIVVSDDNLVSAVKKTGGFRGFALALRVALTNENGKIMVSYTNPEYWGRAYFTKQWGQVNSLYSNVESKFRNALSGFSGNNFVPFGSEDGLSASELKKYHYMFGMPYFEDNIELEEFGSYDEAVRTIERNLSSGKGNTVKVYSIKLDGKKTALFGIGLKGSDGEKLFMPKIDVSSPKHTAFLPYELLIKGNKAYMLHGRYRIALSFPDLSMGQFMKIVSTPGYIEDTFEALCK